MPDVVLGAGRDVVLGVGRQQSLWAVAQLADEQLRTTRGSCRKLVARSAGLELEMNRPQFEGEFQSFAVRFPSQAKLGELVRPVAASCPVPCSFHDENGRQEFRCPTPVAAEGKEQEARDGVHAACDRLSELINIPEVWRVHGEHYRGDHVSSETLFRALVRFRASDVHLFPGSPPVFRVDSVIRRSEMFDPLSAEQITNLIREIAPDKDWKQFQEHQQCSFNFHQIGLGYSRVSAFIKAGVPHCTLRFLPEVIPSFEDLNIPRSLLEKLASLHFGMVLLTGMTGSGKSTTVASLVDWINTNRHVHILCIEEPVEYVHVNKMSVVSQRDVGVDIATFHEAVRGALRHDPDVIVIGEMRDPDTIRSAINAAATGHLVISTLHSNTASEVVNRIISFFDPVERDLVRLQLRDSLKCVICQRLVTKLGGGGGIPALEVLYNDTKHISDNIMIGNTIGIKVGMQQGASDSFIFEKFLYQLVIQGKISLEEARAHASERSIFDQMKLGTYVVPSVESMVHHGAAPHH